MVMVQRVVMGMGMVLLMTKESGNRKVDNDDVGFFWQLNDNNLIFISDISAKMISPLRR